MGEMVAILVSLGFFGMVVMVIYLGVSRKHTERVELIKRGINPEKYDIKLPGKLGLPFGVVFLALGIGPLVAQLITGDWQHTDELGLALASLVGGIGFIVYWKMTAADRERALKIKETLILKPGTDFEPERKPGQ